MGKYPLLSLCCLIFFIQLSPVWGEAPSDALPDNFVYVSEVIPDIRSDLRYYKTDNFLGRRVDGYLKPRLILTNQAAQALKGVQAELVGFGLCLKVFDGYRPQRAVNDFVRWGKDLNDKKMKSEYYPRVRKEELFEKGFIAKRSGHSRGSTVDLTIELINGPSKTVELDMGAPFDFFGPESAADSPLVSPEHRAHRMLLRLIMEKHGFEPYAKEWWHFTLKDEPYKNTYFDFPVQ